MKTVCDVIPSTCYRFSHIRSADCSSLYRAIEDNVQLACGSVIEECVVVGTGRPSPVLFVEPVVCDDAEKLKKGIIRKTGPLFHARRYLHERITSTNMVVVVPRQTLPRTSIKGNIWRKAVEEAYKDVLDWIYGVSAETNLSAETTLYP